MGAAGALLEELLASQPTKVCGRQQGMHSIGACHGSRPEWVVIHSGFHAMHEHVGFLTLETISLNLCASPAALPITPVAPLHRFLRFAPGAQGIRQG